MKTTYSLSCSHPGHEDGILAEGIASLQAAREEMAAIRECPGRKGWPGWMRQADFRITDTDGNVYR